MRRHIGFKKYCFWKTKGIISGESEDKDHYDDWYVQDEVNQEGSEQDGVDGMKKGADSEGKVTHIPKSG